MRSVRNRPPRRAWCVRGFVVIALFACLGAARPARGVDYEDITYDPARYGPEKPLAEVVQDSALVLDEGQFIPNPRIEIEKRTYRLMLYTGDSLLKTYRIQLGKRVRGAKTRRYDGRTPVGSYRICTHNKWSRYYLSMQIDYPNEADIARAIAEKRISEAEARTLRDALAAGDCPSGRTRLGGEIFIHGQFPKVTRQIMREKRKPTTRKDLQPGDLDPGRMKEWYNWTLGCIGMANPDIRELYKHVPNGTPVEIRE